MLCFQAFKEGGFVEARRSTLSSPPKGSFNEQRKIQGAIKRFYSSKIKKAEVLLDFDKLFPIIGEILVSKDISGSSKLGIFRGAVEQIGRMIEAANQEDAEKLEENYIVLDNLIGAYGKFLEFYTRIRLKNREYADIFKKDLLTWGIDDMISDSNGVTAKICQAIEKNFSEYTDKTTVVGVSTIFNLDYVDIFSEASQKSLDGIFAAVGDYKIDAIWNFFYYMHTNSGLDGFSADIERICSKYSGNRLIGALMAYSFEEVRKLQSMDEKMREIGRILHEFDLLGIEYYARYPMEALEDCYLTCTRGLGKSKKLIILNVAKSDYNGAMEQNDFLKGALGQGYHVIIFEAGSDDEVVERSKYFGKKKPSDYKKEVFSQLMREYGPGKTAGGRWYSTDKDFAQISHVHGNQTGMYYGNSLFFSGGKKLDLGDSDIYEKYSPLPVPRLNILLSCSTGLRESVPENLFRENENMAQFLYAAYGTETIAPEGKPHGMELKFKNGVISDVVYMGAGKARYASGTK